MNNKMRYFPQEPWELKKAEESGSPSETGTSFADIRKILEKAKDSPQAKILITLLAVFAALGVAAKDVFADNFMEKLVVIDGDGNATPILNNDGNLTVESSVFINGITGTGLPLGAFEKNKYTIAIPGEDKISMRNNKTLDEISSVVAPNPTGVVVDIETGTKAVAQYDYSGSKAHQIRFIFSDGTEQIFDPNAKNIHALEFSNSKLYVAMQDKTDNKHYIKMFVKGAKGEYEEDMDGKIALSGTAPPDSLEIHNGKIAVTIYNKVLIYNQDTNKLEHDTGSLGGGSIISFGARPGTNEIFMDAYFPSKIVSMDLTTHQIKPLDTEEAIVGSKYGVGVSGFSNDGNRLYIATTNNQQIENHLVTVTLNKDGTYTKTVSDLVPANPIDLSMDVDPDGDKITNGLPDNCPDTANNAQKDKNNNGTGDACENPEEYAASQGYEAYQEPPGTGHNVYTNGNVDIIPMGDSVMIAPVEGEETEVEIINNGNKQTKNIYVKIPPNTDYVWTSFEGYGDDEKTEDVIDFPEGKTIPGETKEEGIVAGISGTDIKLTCTPKIIQPEEINPEQADEFKADETTAEDTSKPDEAILPEEITPDTIEETAPDAIDAQEDVQEIAPDTTLDTDVIQPSDETDAYDPGQSDVQPDTQKDTGTDAGSDTIQPDTEKPNGGGGGCDMNNSANKGAEALTLTGAALLALAAMRRKFAKLLKG